MAEHPNAAVIRAGLDAMNRGDDAAVAAMLDDDVVWHEIGRAEPIRGLAALAAHQTQDVDYEIKGELHDVVANDEHVVALVDATATRGGRTFSYRTAEVYHLRDGKVTERWAFSDDTAAIERFFA